MSRFGLPLALGVGPAGGRGVDRHVGDADLGQLRPHLRDERLEIVADLLGRFAGGDVVAARPQHDQPRPVRDDDPVRVLAAVCNLRAAEAAVEDLVLREVLGKRLPHADGRGTDEQDRPLGRRTGPIGRLEGLDCRLPLPVAGLLGGGAPGRRANHEREDRQGEKISRVHCRLLHCCVALSVSVSSHGRGQFSTPDAASPVHDVQPHAKD